MFKHSKKIITTVILLLTTSALLLASVPQVEAQFVVSSWDYPDEYGQGIDAFVIYENSTGSWLELDPPYDGLYDWEETYVIPWEVGVGIKIRCYAFQNSTLTGASDTNDGKNYQRHSVIVKNFVDSTVFSQQNFTYDSVNDVLDPLWYYGYDVVLNFIPLIGEYYTVTVLYEVYY